MSSDPDKRSKSRVAISPSVDMGDQPKSSSVTFSKKNKSRVGVSPSADVDGRDRSSSVAFAGKSFSRMKMRKKSYGFSGIPTVGGQLRRRSSLLGIEYKRPALIFLNTYQLEPRTRFDVAKVTKAIDEILDAHYTGSKYSATETPGETMLIADTVMRAVKAMNFDRYRIISIVTMAQKRAQCYNNAVAFLWDHEFDNLVDTHRENISSFIQVTVFGVYLD